MDTHKERREIVKWHIYTHAENSTQHKLEWTQNKWRAVWQLTKAILEDYWKKIKTCRALCATSRVLWKTTEISVRRTTTYIDVLKRDTGLQDTNKLWTAILYRDTLKGYVSNGNIASQPRPSLSPPTTTILDLPLVAFENCSGPTDSLVECLLSVRDVKVQSQTVSYQIMNKKW